eukprot:bmy_16221T0
MKYALATKRKERNDGQDHRVLIHRPYIAAQLYPWWKPRGSLAHWSCVLTHKEDVPTEVNNMGECQTLENLMGSLGYLQAGSKKDVSPSFQGDAMIVTYLGKVPTTGMQFLSGCTEKPVIELWKKHTLAREDVFPANALLEIRPFQVWLHHLDHKGEATVHMDTFQVARIAYCTADHNVSPDIFAWVYREINDDLSYQMDCHAVECESKLEAKKLAHAMMEAFKKTFHSMKSDGRIHRNGSSEEVSQELESDDG